MFLACPKSKVTIKLKFCSNLKNAVETAKIAVDSCYVLRQFLTSVLACVAGPQFYGGPDFQRGRILAGTGVPSIDFREIRGLHYS